MKRVVVLISGRGTNLQALQQRFNDDLQQSKGVAQIVGDVSNRGQAEGLAWAQLQGLRCSSIDHRGFHERVDFDQALAERVADFRPDLVVLAGFMRVLGADFVHRFPARIINIHPSLLPAFPGLNTHRRALDAGVRVHGATVHYVTEALDAGPIIAQAAVPVLEDDDEQSLAARVLKQEHRLLPNAVIDICCERIGLDVSGKLWTRPGARRLLADDFNACALAVPGLSGAP